MISNLKKSNIFYHITTLRANETPCRERVVLSLAIEKRWDYWDDLPSEKEELLINKIAEFVVEHKMDLIAEILLETGGPISSIFASFGLNLFGPYLEFFGADTYTALFRRRENIQRLIDAIEKITDEKKSKREQK